MTDQSNIHRRVECIARWDAPEAPGGFEARSLSLEELVNDASNVDMLGADQVNRVMNMLDHEGIGADMDGLRIDLHITFADRPLIEP